MRLNLQCRPKGRRYKSAPNPSSHTDTSARPKRSFFQSALVAEVEFDRSSAALRRLNDSAEYRDSTSTIANHPPRPAHWRCPNGGRGRLFRGVFRMLSRCPECGLSYFPEQGYYLGAMIINYAATTACVVTIFLVSLLISGLHQTLDQRRRLLTLDGFRDHPILIAGGGNFI